MSRYVITFYSTVFYSVVSYHSIFYTFRTFFSISRLLKAAVKTTESLWFFNILLAKECFKFYRHMDFIDYHYTVPML